jgi:hypothetical protein
LGLFFYGGIFAFLRGFLKNASAFTWFWGGESVVERAELWGFGARFSVTKNTPLISSLFFGFPDLGIELEDYRLYRSSTLYRHARSSSCRPWS